MYKETELLQQCISNKAGSDMSSTPKRSSLAFYFLSFIFFFTDDPYLRLSLQTSFYYLFVLLQLANSSPFS
jgi:hypothetical protein